MSLSSRAASFTAATLLAAPGRRGAAGFRPGARGDSVDVVDVDDELWTAFHTAVNMTSRELRDWLATEGAGEDSERFPDQAGSPVGQDVLHVLGKRRGDLTRQDLDVMRGVVDLIEREHPDPEQPVTDDRLRHRLMGVGHDPLRSG